MLNLLDPSPKPKDLLIILKVKHQSSGIEKTQLLKYWGVYKILASPPLTSFMFGSSLFPILLSLHALSCQSSARNYADSSLWKHAVARIYTLPPFPFCTFLLNCLKMDDLKLIWRSNIFRTIFILTPSVFWSSSSIIKGWPYREVQWAGLEGVWEHVHSLVTILSGLCLFMSIWRALRCICWSVHVCLSAWCVRVLPEDTYWVKWCREDVVSV